MMGGMPELVAAGIPVTVNSDDPPMFSTTLNDEYLAAAQLVDLDADGLAELARAGVRASFLADDRKSALVDEIDKYAHAAGPETR